MRCALSTEKISSVLASQAWCAALKTIPMTLSANANRMDSKIIRKEIIIDVDSNFVLIMYLLLNTNFS